MLNWTVTAHNSVQIVSCASLEFMQSVVLFVVLFEETEIEIEQNRKRESTIPVSGYFWVTYMSISDRCECVCVCTLAHTLNRVQCKIYFLLWINILKEV